jgi:hypothetical protein
VEELDVPGSTKGGTARETGCFHTIKEAGATDAVGTVRNTDGGDIETGDGNCMPPIVAYVNSE